VPVIVQSKSGVVLTLAYANATALEEMVATRRTVFWSRSRDALWRKGETSGNWQEVLDIESDCDGDALLVKVIAHGPACHRGTDSCFEGGHVDA
jgi:phosphoribosyl-ATP pyrophosphohydrolase/phosphoribosyl-AMP cyclohydrolase